MAVKPLIQSLMSLKTIVKEHRTERRYAKMIKASQDKIGPYKPASIPVQIWA